MSLTLSNPTLATTFTSTEIDANFADIATKFGNIDNTDVKAGAAIDIDKNSAQYDRILLTLKAMVSEPNGAGTFETNGFAGVITAIAAGTRLDMIPLPGDSSDANWELYDAMWACTDTGAGDTVVRVEWGYFDAVGTWTVSATPIGNVVLANAAAANDANDAHIVNSSGTTLDFNHATGGNTPRSLALVLDTQGANTMSNLGDYLVFSLLLRRKIQAV